MLAGMLVAVGGGPAQAQVSPLLGSSATDGHIDLSMLAPAGAAVAFSELVDGVREPLGSGLAMPGPDGITGAAQLRHATRWRCDRVLRTFVATATSPAGEVLEATGDVRTPGCERRLAVSVPKRVERGGRLRVTVRDRWALGDLTVTVCARRPKTQERCRTLTMPEGRTKAVTTRKVSSVPGRVDVSVRYGRYYDATFPVGVGRTVTRSDLPVLLATGDSMIQGIDAFIGDRLHRSFDVVRESYPGSAISKPEATPWTARAFEQGTKLTPAVTVVSIGANDRFPMSLADGTQEPCCTPAWAAEYVRRATAMIRRWSKPAKGRVLWLTLPAPRDARYAPAFAVVNDALERMAGTIANLELVRVDELLSAGGQYRETINGKVVRDPDGLHLSVAGQHLVAEAVVRAIRRPRPAGPR